MTEIAPTPRALQLLDRFDAWGARGPLRSVLMKVAVTVLGPLVIVAGIAMTVLPGPGLVVVGIGFTLLALEYPWARSVLQRAGQLLRGVRRAAFPAESSPGRKAVGVAAGVAFFAATTVLTGAITAYVGSQAFL